MEKPTYDFQEYKSPLGKLYLVSKGSKLQAIIFQKYWKAFKENIVDIQEANSQVLKKCTLELEQYFSGKRKTFTVPYELDGTDFQKKAWLSLRNIPYGETKSYKDQAKLLKSPKAVRAVGTANKYNPLCIILPCHRVIGSDGSLSGYAGGIKAKKFLLALENKN